MKTRISNIFALLFVLPMLMLATGCSKDEPRLDLDGNTFVKSLRLDEYEADIDNLAKTVKVGVPYGKDVTAMKLTAIELSEGAVADIAIGEVLNCTAPRNLRVTNADVYTDYLITVEHDNAYFTSFTLDGKYQGTIDNEARTVLVFVPLEADVTKMLATYTTNEGGSGVPQSGSVVDFSNPVKFTLTVRSAVIDYKVTVVQDDMSQEPKAFVGNAASVDGLGDEARAAAVWMLNNVPNSTFVSLQDVLNGTVKLSDYKMVWAHLDFTDWPGVMWDTRDIFNDYYIKGGNILATRDGARYINDVWRIALDQQSPNNMFGGDSAEALTEDMGVCVEGYEGHEIYAGLPLDGTRLLLASKGISNTGRTLQWCVDWDPYCGMSGWEERTGARALGFDNGGNKNNVQIAEFPSREVLKGYQSGVVLCIGTPAYEWYQANGQNAYRDVLEKFTKNAINYLCK